MKKKQLRALIKLRIQQAHDTLNEAVILLKEHSYRGVINRSYYAMFYSVLALLAIKKLGTSKHSGAISLFDREFVKTGTFSKELSKSLHLAFDRRQTHDYGEIFEINEEIARQQLEDAEIFVKEVNKFLSKAGYLAKE